MFLESLKVSNTKIVKWLRTYYPWFRPYVKQAVEDSKSQLDDTFFYMIDFFMDYKEKGKKNEKKV